MKKIKNTITKNQFRILSELLTGKLVELMVLIGEDGSPNVDGKIREALIDEYTDVCDLLNSLENPDKK